MKLRCVLAFSIIILSALVTMAQKRDYEIEVSFDETSITQTSAKIPVKVKIHNRAEKLLSTTGLNNIHFYFAKCALGSPCERKGDIYTAFTRIPAKRIKENESFEFEINLAALFWKDIKINPNYTEDVKNFKTVPSTNIYFYSGIKSLAGFKMKSFKGANKKSRPIVQRKPIYKVVNSNVVSVSFN